MDIKFSRCVDYHGRADKKGDGTMRDIGGQTVWELIDQGAAGSNVDLVISEGNCKVLKLSDKTGEGVMTMYQVFNGVYLMFNDFHMESCYSGYFVMARIIQKLLGGDRELAGYLTDCLVMAVMWCARVLFHSLSTSASHRATFAVLGNIRKRGRLKLERMPLGDVQVRGSGELKNILVERVDSIEVTLAHVIPEVTSNVCVVLATIVYLLMLDWRMALVSLITLPLGMLCFMLMMVGYEENYGRTVRATKNLNDTAVEYIGGIEVIKVFGKAKSSYEKFVAAAKEGAASYVDWMRKCNVYFTFAMNIMPATLVTVLPVGGLLVRNGSLSVPDFILIVILAMGLITPIIGCMTYNDDLAKLRTVLGEVTAILDADELPRPAKDEETPRGSTVQLSDVHFGYNEKEVLHGVSAAFREGTVNALVGPSGGGKSTIAKLIASYWDVNSGTIARAIMKDAPIIILDEATANVDPENEKGLMEAIDELTKEKTILMIAHRLKTVQGADQILVVDQGRIVQCGTHSELMKEDGIYRRFISGREQAVSWKL